jgi:hypothetical protein
MQMVKYPFMFCLIVLLMKSPPAYCEGWAVDNGSAYMKGSQTLGFGFAAVPFGLTAAYEYGFHEAISGSMATGVILNPYLYVPVIGRAAFHPFNLKAWAGHITVRDKLDPYIGLGMGFELGEDAPDLFVFREYIGIRFRLNSKYALYAEDCAGLGFFNFGLTINL